MRVRASHKRLDVLLRREGWPVNHKRIYRLYTEEGLTLKRRRPKRHRSPVVRRARPTPSRSNEQQAMDFMHDGLACGQTIRLLTGTGHTSEIGRYFYVCHSFLGAPKLRLRFLGCCALLRETSALQRRIEWRFT
jgi:transposase InsO family protein